MSEAAAEPMRRILRCLFCRQPGYWVQNAQGDVFFVTHSGKRWCPLRAHRSNTPTKRKRRGKR